MKLPALRDRREDIPYLTAAFVREAAERLQQAARRADRRRRAPARDRRAWEGNVRELRNVIERACILADGDVHHRARAVGQHAAMTRASRRAPRPATVRPAAPRHDSDSLANVERDHIQRALAKAGGNKKAAAQMLGLSRRALYRRLERLDLADAISRRREHEPMVMVE